MKFNITSLTCLPKPNTLFLSAVVTSVPFQLSSISTLPNTSFNFYLNPWFKQSTKPLQVFKFNSLKIKQTFKLLSLQNNCYYVSKKKHNISTLFIRSNLSLKIQTVNYSKLTPTISKLLKLFLTCNSFSVLSFTLYSTYLYNYLQLLSTTRLLKPTLLLKNTKVLTYKSLFTRNLLSL